MVAPDNLILVDVPNMMGAVQIQPRNPGASGRSKERGHYCTIPPAHSLLWPQADKDPGRGDFAGDMMSTAQ